MTANAENFKIDMGAVIKEYFSFLDSKEFPCIAAKAALSRQNVKCMVAGNMACPKDDAEIYSLFMILLMNSGDQKIFTIVLQSFSQRHKFLMKRVLMHCYGSGYSHWRSWMQKRMLTIPV